MHPIFRKRGRSRTSYAQLRSSIVRKVDSHPPLKLTPLEWAHILSFELVSTGNSKGISMPNVAIPYHIDSALERGLEGRGIAREDALSLMEQAPLETLLQAAASVRDRFKGNSVS